VIQVEVRDRLTDEILFGQLQQGGTVTIGVAGERLDFAIEPAAPPAPDAAGRQPVSTGSKG
jgi:hypothetical protein